MKIIGRSQTNWNTGPKAKYQHVFFVPPPPNVFWQKKNHHCINEMAKMYFLTCFSKKKIKPSQILSNYRSVYTGLSHCPSVCVSFKCSALYFRLLTGIRNFKQPEIFLRGVWRRDFRGTEHYCRSEHTFA